MVAKNINFVKNPNMGKRIVIFQDEIFDRWTKKFTFIIFPILLISEFILLYGGLITYGNDKDVTVMIVPFLFGLGVFIYWIDLPWKRYVVLYERGIEFWTYHSIALFHIFQPYAVYFNEIHHIHQTANGRLSIGGIYLKSEKYYKLILSTFIECKQLQH